jgi:hypothetical protein
VSDAAVPTLTSIVPQPAVPERLRYAVNKVLAGWSFSWDDITFAGTADVGHGDEIWIFAISAGPLAVGDELESAGGRGAGVAVSAFSGGVIPVTPYQARVYEYLGRRGGGGPAPERQPPPQVPTTPDMEPATPDPQDWTS